MRTRCPHCQQELYETNVSENIGWGKYPDCNGIFCLRDDLIVPDTPRQPESHRKNRIVIEQDNNTLTAFFPPPRGFLGWVFLIAMFFFLGAIVFVLLVLDPDFPRQARLIFSSILAAFGLLEGILAVYYFFTSRTIRIDYETLDIETSMLGIRYRKKNRPNAFLGN
ncbi:MAG: hypothetical protein LBT05_13920 [Planctomycetaceae bacterium]|jgi:hypothetical protein|nr:hypothetical protein [Planctomycetaceae bacterium]